MTASYAGFGSACRHCSRQPRCRERLRHRSERPDQFCGFKEAPSSGAEILVFGIVRRVYEHGRVLALAEDLDRDLRSNLREFRLHVADREALLQHVSVISRSRAADHLPLGVEQRLVTERIGILHAMYVERHEAVRYAGRELALERGAPRELALLHAHESVEARLE